MEVGEPYTKASFRIMSMKGSGGSPDQAYIIDSGSTFSKVTSLAIVNEQASEFFFYALLRESVSGARVTQNLILCRVTKQYDATDSGHSYVLRLTAQLGITFIRYN